VDRIAVVLGLEPELVARVVARLRDLEPATVAILVSGSYAKETADEASDLDLQVVTQGEPVAPYRMWFEERTDAKPLHVSPSVKSLAVWLAKRDEPQAWSFGLPVEHVVRYVWATAEARAALGDPPTNRHPPAPPELEDFVEYAQKLRRLEARGDFPLMRLRARQAAMLAPGLLRAVNDDVLVHDTGEALEAALTFAAAPQHYREDMTVCLGLVRAHDAEVFDAALRLARELLALLREHAPDADPQPDIARYLADGTLERHLGFL
jgi:phosphoribosyl-AMP cyclohydrolase